MGLSIPILAGNLERHILNFATGSDMVHNFRIGREPISFASFNAARKRNIPFIFTPFHHTRW
jgi:hypothetical protein